MNRALSLYLDALRIGAALMVFARHLSYPEITGGLLRLPNTGHLGVVIFFVLSGYVMAWLVGERETDWRDYAAARVSRLVSVALPALLLTVVLDWIGSSHRPDLYARFAEDSYPLIRFLASLTFMQQVWFIDLRPFSNGPYWSLGFEAWYYLLFGVAMFARRERRTAALVLLCIVAGPPMLLMLPTWVMGVAAYRVQKRLVLGRAVASVVFLGTLVVLATVVSLDWISAIPKAGFLGQAKTFWFDWGFAALVALNVVAATQVLADVPDWPFARATIVRAMANATFPLYLCHFPLLLCVRAVFPEAAAGYAGVLLQVVILCSVVAAMTYMTDGLKQGMRRAFHRLVQGSPRQLLYNRQP